MAQENAADQSAVQKASQELQDTLEKEAPSATEIKAKLTALRGAREKAKQELVKAQSQLKEVLTVKQEAQLVIMGMID
jgi:Spy/CpxP family protein refolding chaperone